MIDDRFDSPALSEAGLRRREEILRAAIRAAGCHRRRRQFLRASAPLAAVVLAVFLAARFESVQKSPRVQIQPPGVAVVPPPPTAPVSPPAAPGVTITRIQTDPTLLDRLSVPRQKRDWQVLDDEQLLQALAAAGRPAGLEYATDGQVMLLYRDPGN